MYDPSKIDSLLGRLASSSAVLGGLPEDPGYNGSRLIIDDQEAAKIGGDIDSSIAAINDLRNFVRLVFASTPPYRGDGSSVFSEQVSTLAGKFFPQTEPPND